MGTAALFSTGFVCLDDCKELPRDAQPPVQRSYRPMDGQHASGWRRESWEGWFPGFPFASVGNSVLGLGSQFLAEGLLTRPYSSNFPNGRLKTKGF